MSDISDYCPIDCELHDQYESACVLRQMIDVEIDGVVHSVLVLDVVQKENAEYLALDGFENLVRLDQFKFIGISKIL